MKLQIAQDILKRILKVTEEETMNACDGHTYYTVTRQGDNLIIEAKDQIGKYKGTEQLFRELYEVERTQSAILQTFTYITDIVEGNDTLRAIVQDLTGSRNQLREIMVAMGYTQKF